MRHLVLRTSADVTKAFVLSPLAAIGTFWLCVVGFGMVHRQYGIVIDLILIPWLAIFGTLVCAAVEFIVVAPLVSGMRTYGWRWLNWGWVVPIGVFAGALPVLLIVVVTSDLRDLLKPDLQLMLGGFGIAGVAGAVTFARIAMMPADR